MFLFMIRPGPKTARPRRLRPRISKFQQEHRPLAPSFRHTTPALPLPIVAQGAVAPLSSRGGR
jgi:hypothetical protein